MGGVSKIIQSYFTNRSENWIENFREHFSWSGLSSLELISGVNSLCGHHGPESSKRAPYKDLHPFLGYCAQACNRASRNLATVVGGLSISMKSNPIWSQICPMGFRSGLRAGHCMDSTSSPARKLRVFRAMWIIALSCTSTKSLWKVAPTSGRRFWRKIPM